ncbi:MAG: hypothetical protein KAV82_11775 [Phycisphaerae bacterium]|nr:hypothetical protein [Phycisphaerae bacterium]
MIPFDVRKPESAPVEFGPEQTRFLARFEKHLRKGLAIRVWLGDLENGPDEFDQVVEWLGLAPLFFARRGLLVYARLDDTYAPAYWIVPAASLQPQTPAKSRPQHQQTSDLRAVLRDLLSVIVECYDCHAPAWHLARALEDADVQDLLLEQIDEGLDNLASPPPECPTKG